MNSIFPPSDIERALLGYILEHPQQLEHLGALNPEDFFDSRNSRIFVQCLSMAERGDHIDLTTVVHALGVSGALQEAGGAGYIADLLNGVCTYPDTKAYAKIVKDASMRRTLTRQLEALVSRAANPTVRTEELIVQAEKLLIAHRDGMVAEKKIEFLSASQLMAQIPPEVNWVAHGFVARGAITLLIGKVKSAGKTTFSTHLAASVLKGIPFAGMATRQGPVLYLSEQSTKTLTVAIRRAGLSDCAELAILSWPDLRDASWPEVMRVAARHALKMGAGLIVIDTIGQFTGLAGDAENNAGDALRAMQPIQRAAAEGIAILVTQHERKGGGDIEDSGRGSSAFAGAADIVLSMRRFQGNSAPNLRTIRALSRFDETPSEVTLEFTPEGYIARDTGIIAQQRVEDCILAVVLNQKNPCSAIELCKAAGVKRTTGQEAIDRMLRGNKLNRQGTGRKGSPFRYYLPNHSSGNKLSKADDCIPESSEDPSR